MGKVVTHLNELTNHVANADPHAVYLTQPEGDALYSVLAHTHTFASLTSKPTTLVGYGITDAATSSHTHAGMVTEAGAQTLTNKIYIAPAEYKVTLGTNAINVSNGSYFTRTLTANATFTVSGAANSGLVSAFILELTNGGAYTVNWWTGVKWASGTAPTLTASGTDILGFYTHDGGTTWRGVLLSADSK